MAGPAALRPVLRCCPPGHPGGQDAELLGPSELERAAALALGPRATFVAGRLALRSFAADLLGVPASELATHFSCPRCGTGPGLSHGRPGYSLRGKPVPLALSLARSSGWILLAAVVEPPEGLTIGVDLEDPARLDFDGFDAVALTEAERGALAGLSGQALVQERARLWARKEAWLKMTGTGLTTAPDTLDVLRRPEIRDLAAGEAGLPRNFRAAVALSPAGYQRPELTQHSPASAQAAAVAPSRGARDAAVPRSPAPWFGQRPG